MEWIIAWIAFAIIAGVIADAKGRSGGGWALLGFLIGPLALVVGLLPAQEKVDQAQARRSGVAGDYRKCPVCAEAVRREAIKCRFCGAELQPVDWRGRPAAQRSPETQAVRLSPEAQAEVNRRATVRGAMLLIVLFGILALLWVFFGGAPR